MKPLHVLRVWGLCALFCLLINSSAMADDASLDEMVVTASKTEVDAQSIPFTFFTVDRAKMDQQPDFAMDNVGEVIRDLPGVHVAQYYPWGPPWIHLRGTGYFIGRTVYLIDGLPTHSFMSSAIHPRDLERMDVLLGPSSALYGPNASGGCVNMVTRSGKSMGYAATDISYGSNNTFRPHAAVGSLKDNFSYYFSFSGDYSDGYHMKPVDGMMELYDLGKRQYIKGASLEPNESRQSWITANVQWETEGGASMALNHHYTQRYLYGGHPNSILNDDGEQYITTARLKLPLGEIGKLKISSAYHYDDHPMQDTNGISVVGGIPVADSTISHRTDWTRAIRPTDIQTDFYIGDHLITTGGFYSRETEKNHQIWWAGNNTKYRSVLNTTQTAAYLQDHWLLMDDRLSLMGGVRYDHWKYHDIFDSGSTDTTPPDVSKDYTTFRGGAKYRFNDRLSLRTSVGSAYWPGLAKWFFQNITEGLNQREANPNLKPEKTLMGDVGLDMGFGTGTLLSMTGYYGEIQDMVSYSYDENPNLPGGHITRTRNLGTAEIYGLELSLNHPLTDHLKFESALTLNHSRIKDDPDNNGNQLRNAPDYWGSLGLTYENPQWLSGSVLFRFSDDRYYDDANTQLPYFHMKAYETLDVKVWRDWHLSRGLTLSTSLSCVNLLDKEYATEICYVNPGRYVEAGIGLKRSF